MRFLSAGRHFVQHKRDLQDHLVRDDFPSIDFSLLFLDPGTPNPTECFRRPGHSLCDGVLKALFRRRTDLNNSSNRHTSTSPCAHSCVHRRRMGRQGSSRPYSEKLSSPSPCGKPATHTKQTKEKNR